MLSRFGIFDSKDILSSKLCDVAHSCFLLVSVSLSFFFFFAPSSSLPTWSSNMYYLVSWISVPFWNSQCSNALKAACFHNITSEKLVFPYPDTVILKFTDGTLTTSDKTTRFLARLFPQANKRSVKHKGTYCVKRCLRPCWKRVLKAEPPSERQVTLHSAGFYMLSQVVPPTFLNHLHKSLVPPLVILLLPRNSLETCRQSKKDSIELLFVNGYLIIYTNV